MAPGWIVGMRAHREQVAALLAADDDESRRRVTARLGAVLTPKDGSWIAISYRDDHTMPFAFSSTVARCSDGTWMESDYHFCGELSGYAKQRDMYREWMKAAATPEERENCRKMIEEAGSNTLLDEAEASASLAEAKAILQQMGLRSMRSPR